MSCFLLTFWKPISFLLLYENRRRLGGPIATSRGEPCGTGSADSGDDNNSHRDKHSLRHIGAIDHDLDLQLLSTLNTIVASNVCALVQRQLLHQAVSLHYAQGAESNDALSMHDKILCAAEQASGQKLDHVAAVKWLNNQKGPALPLATALKKLRAARNSQAHPLHALDRQIAIFLHRHSKKENGDRSDDADCEGGQGASPFYKGNHTQSCTPKEIHTIAGLRMTAIAATTTVVSHLALD